MANDVYRRQVAGILSKQPWFVLNAATHYDLVISDNPAISHFYSFEANHQNGLAFAIPDGCVDIVFDCNSEQPSARVCGTTLEARCAQLQDHHRYFGVRFAFGVIPDFLNLAADQLVDHEINLLELLPHAREMIEQISNEPQVLAQSRLFEHFFRSFHNRQPSALTLESMQRICQHKGNIQIQQLAEQTGRSRRTLHRQFIDDLGMSPKAFSRIVRCQSAVYDINHQQDVVFSALASDLGFSDQSHFLREFKKCVNATPADYQGQVQQQDYLQRIRHFGHPSLITLQPGSLASWPWHSA
ncbi:AraC family transcriptional regulator [Oceanobacter mangrovi]|uniref:AraC family transcriptional regulator n=1 Tax=Oceanobacter mangrovi TaxID=2862510 RepID=UPI001C8E78D6|nr:helix-turn-helix domain-containing protein [Oceanobacter mangrovi]